jgi:hypothetical protein
VKTLICSFLFLLACLSPLSAGAASVQNLSWSQVQEQVRQDPSQNIVIEFYRSTPDGLDCDRCEHQEAAFAETAGKYDSRVLFVRVDAATAPRLKELGIVAIYPTHLFVRHNVPQGQEMVARKVMGYVSADDLSELIYEFFEIN